MLKAKQGLQELNFRKTVCALASTIIYFQHEKGDTCAQGQAAPPGVELQKDCMCVSKDNHILLTRERGSMFLRPSKASRG